MPEHRSTSRGPTSRSPGPLLWAHPEWTLAVKAALAVGLSWSAVQPLGGVADRYPYYAPLGAVVAMSTTVVTSLRTSLQAVAAIAAGGALALAARPLPVPSAVALVAAVAVAMLLAGWSGWGSMGSWVPIAAVFVLLLGGSDPWHYVLGYAGLTALGAAIGTVVNAALPQLPVEPATRAQEQLRRSLVRRLRELAELLESDDPPGPQRMPVSEFRTSARQLDELVSRARQARRGNWRAGRWAALVERRERQARALEHIAGQVEEAATLLADGDNPVHRDDGTSLLRRRIAHALRATADVLDADPGADRTEGAHLDAAQDALAALRRTALDEADRPDDERLTGASVAMTLERALRAWQ